MLNPVSPLPLSEFPTQDLAQIQLVATDVDGTLTHHHQFTPELLTALQALTTAGITVLITTGRSAGWVEALAYYLPVAGAIAENGGLYCNREDKLTLLTAIPDIVRHRQQLAQAFQGITNQFPGLQASGDNRFRLTDWTFDVAGLTQEQLATIAAQCQAQGWGFTYSTVQAHIKPFAQDKASGLRQVLASQFSAISPEQVVTIGDSPNDDPMFNSEAFPRSVGVANLLPYCPTLEHPPRYITPQPEVAGFCQLVQCILAAR
jgi:HAD superfamily hydrolase (TIGR01484 family)